MSGKSTLLDEATDNPGPAAAFWQWFIENEKRFRDLENNNSEQALDFLSELIQEMKPFNPWLKALAGPHTGDEYELIITSDGDVALFCKVEELVQAAPKIDYWIVTAHKPALGFEGVSIDLYGKEFSTETTHFYPIIYNDYPDEVNIILTHKDYDKKDDEHFQAGGMIYLENGLGEVNTATKIDNYETGPEPPPEKGIEMIPITKLADYLNWREKEFVEKYESVNAEKPAENFHLLEAEDKEGKVMLATVDAGFKNWNAKQAYPWLLHIDINFEGEETGMPSDEQLQQLQDLEDEMVALLPVDGSIYYTGHRIYNNCRNIYFYTNDYKKSTKALHDYLAQKETDYEIVFFVRMEKYWRTMEQYFNVLTDD